MNGGRSVRRRFGQRGGSTLLMVVSMGVLLMFLIPVLLDTFAMSRNVTRIQWLNTRASELAISNIDAFVAYYNGYTGDTSDLQQHIEKYDLFPQPNPCPSPSSPSSWKSIAYTLRDGTAVTIDVSCTYNAAAAPDKTNYTVRARANVEGETAIKEFSFDSRIKSSTKVAGMFLIPVLNIDRIPIGNDTPTTIINIPNYNLQKYELDYRLWYTVYRYAEQNSYVFDHNNNKGDRSGREGHDGGLGFLNGGQFKKLLPNSSFEKPVTHVSFNNVIVWLNAFSEMEGRTSVYRDSSNTATVWKDATKITSFNKVYVNPTANGYRLPTQHQWEIAARWIGKTACNPVANCISSTDTISNTKYYWTKFDHPAGATGSGSNDLETVAWYKANASDKVQPIGKKQPNSIDFYDMSGNVREMTVEINTNNQITGVKARGGSWETLFTNKTKLTVGHLGDSITSTTMAEDDIGIRILRNQ